MNLVTDKWIPVVRLDGKADKVSLNEVFAQGDRIADLSVRPHERIALMRLLICIAQAALDGPKDFTEWKSCKDSINNATLDYLEKWQSAFNLFGSGPRFLQARDIAAGVSGGTDTDDSGGLASKLDAALATGNNTTLFDNAGGTDRAFAPDRLALFLLSFQCFSPLIGRGYKGRSPCVEGNMVHCILKADDVISTIHLNLLTKDFVARCYGVDKWGSPLWEKMPSNKDDSGRIANATETYLGRMTPLARSVWFNHDGAGMILDNGLAYSHFREPWSAIRVSKNRKTGEDTRRNVDARIGRDLWRELHSLTVKSVGDTAAPGGPLTLTNIPETDAFDLWIGGMATDYKAKVLDVVESIFTVPSSMLHDRGMKAYENGVKYADNIETCLYKGTHAYAMCLKLERTPYAAAQTVYWTRVDCNSGLLLQSVSRVEGFTEWRKLAKAAALEAYERACPRQTPREIQAFAAGLRVLFKAVKKLESSKSRQEAA